MLHWEGRYYEISNQNLIPDSTDFLYTACVHGDFDIVNFLIEERGFDPHYIPDCGRSPLHGTCTDVE